MDAEVVEKLKELGASEFDHVNGTLLAHLQGTHDLLEKWGNRGALCNAGLYHAVYGTAGFQQNLIGLQDRSAVADLIGKESENIVYLFSACDRDYVYGQMLASDGFDQVTKVEYRDRFSQATYPLDPGAFARSLRTDDGERIGDCPLANRRVSTAALWVLEGHSGENGSPRFYSWD